MRFQYRPPGMQSSSAMGPLVVIGLVLLSEAATHAGQIHEGLGPLAEAQACFQRSRAPALRQQAKTWRVRAAPCPQRVEGKHQRGAKLMR
jgi:hypothetical protein